MNAPQQPGDEDWQPTPYPTDLIRTTRAQLAERVRLYDSEIADLLAQQARTTSEISALRELRVRDATTLQEYGVAAEVLASYAATVQADRRAQWEDEAADTYTPCTEEETHA